VYEQTPEPDQYSSIASALEARERARGALRVGYRKARLPSPSSTIRETSVGLTWRWRRRWRTTSASTSRVPVDLSHFDEQLVAGEVDLVPSAPYARHWLGRVRLSQPRIDGTLDCSCATSAGK
jgi:hypothetical protein